MKNTKKNIAFVIGKLSSGGAERVISTLSNEFINRFNVTIITLEESVPFYALHKDVNVVACYEQIKKPNNFYQSIKLNYNLVKRISQIAKDQKIDLLIGFITSANIITTIAAKLNRIPCIISERNNPLMNGVPKFWALLRTFIYPMANRLVLQTQGVKKIYEKKMKIKKLVVLPNPISSDLSQLRKFDTEKKKVILTVGRLIEDKGHKDLIEAFGNIKLEGWKVQIIGDGNYKKKLMKFIEENNLSDKVEVLSKIKNIDSYYNQASIFVFTSKTEGFPNALLEAMHFGLPTISTDCNFGPSDLIKDGVNGYLIPVGNKGLLTNRLNKLTKEEALQKQFSKNAIDTTEKYKSYNVAQQWEDLINSQI